MAERLASKVRGMAVTARRIGANGELGKVGDQLMEACTQKPAQIPSTQRVYEAVRELRAVEQIATRETVAELTGLKLSIVDDRLRTLVDDGKLKRLLRGIYELVEQFPPPRQIWTGDIDGGWVKVEVGDDHVLTLTPTEARKMARALGGHAEDARVIESTNQHLFLATSLAAKVEALERKMKAMTAHNPNPAQGDLLAG
jgi:hypothetical protein